jgi:hypothetical protein
MGIGSYSKGWGSQDDYDDYRRDGENRDNGGGSQLTENERMYRFRFSVPTPEGTEKQPNLTPGRPAKKRVLFLDGEPFKLREHGLWTPDGRFRDAYRTIGANTAVCLEANKLYKECPVCAPNGGDLYAYSIGFFTVIDMGQVLYEDGHLSLLPEVRTSRRGKEYEIKFPRVLLGAKQGSQDKPGVLKTLQFKMRELQDRHGWKDLTGTVWDTTRTGKKAASVGDSWEFIERVLPEDWEEFLVRHGADPEHLNLTVPEYSNDQDGIFDFDVKEYYKKLRLLVGWDAPGGNRQQHERQDASTQGAGYGGGGQQGSMQGNSWRQGGSAPGGNGYQNGPYGGDAPPPGDDDIPF